MENSINIDISGTEAVVELGTKVYDVLENNYITGEDEYPIMAILSNRLLLSLSDKVEINSKWTPIHLNTNIGFDIFRRSLSFLLSAICYSLFPERELEVIISCSKGISYKLSGDRISDEEWNKIVEKMRDITSGKNEDILIRTSEMFVDDACTYFKETHRGMVSDLINQRRDSLYRNNWVKVSSININNQLLESNGDGNFKYSTLFIDPLIYKFSKEYSKYFDNYEIMREKEHGEYSSLFKNYFIISLPDKMFKEDIKLKSKLQISEELGEGKNDKIDDNLFHNIIPPHLHKSLVRYYRSTLPYRNDYISQLNNATYKLNQSNFEFAIGKMNNGAYKLANPNYLSNESEDKSFSMVHYTELYIRQQLADICSLVTAKTRLILISGPSSSGKTTFSHRLAEALIMHSKYPKIPVVLGMDMYYKNQTDCPILRTVIQEDGSEKIYRDFENPDALKVDLINEHLKALIEGKEVRMPKFDFFQGMSFEGEGKKIRLIGVGDENDDIDETNYPLPPSGCIIMEGIHGLNPRFSASIPDDEKLLIFIHPHTSIKIDPITPFRSTYDRLIRRSVRDARSRGYTIASTVSRWSSVRQGELSYIFENSKNGNYIFNSIHEEELAALSGVYDAVTSPQGNDVMDDEDEEAGSTRASLSATMGYITRMSVTAMKNEIPSDSILREFIGGLLFGEPH